LSTKKNRLHIFEFQVFNTEFFYKWEFVHPIIYYKIFHLYIFYWKNLYICSSTTILLGYVCIAISFSFPSSKERYLSNWPIRCLHFLCLF